MKTLTLTLLIAMIGFFSIEGYSQARVQVIHNSADLAADTVDVWLDNTLLLDNFAFRTASPFINAPAAVDFDIRIKDKNSMDTTNPLFKRTYNLVDAETYVLVANGIVSGSGYSPATPFDIDVFAMGQESSSNPSAVDFLVYHGSTDAPPVDLVEIKAGAGLLVNNISYSEFRGYVSAVSPTYTLQVRDSSNSVVVAEFGVPVGSVFNPNDAAVVLASGFLNPSNNSNGPAFGLFVAPVTGGELVALPSQPVSPARVQVIHNSADAAADTVDVWLDNTLLLDNFAFRNASPFVDAPQGMPFDVRIQPKNSTDTTNPIAKFTYSLIGGETYVLIANGIVSGSGYNPATPFNIDVYPFGKERANPAGYTDLNIYHGSTDAPAVDLVGLGLGTVVDDLTYSMFTGYVRTPVADYSLQVRDATGTVVVAQYSVPLSSLSLGDQAVVALASGFLNPANNSNGPAFGIYVALATGGELLALPTETIAPARIQVIHNSADLAADSVDVWLDNTLLLDNFPFRTATPFIDAPTGVNFDVRIQPKNSSDTTNPLYKATYNLTGGETYVLVANGIVSGSGYSPNVPFDIHVFAMGKERADVLPGRTDMLVFHGSTDAPTVDIVNKSNDVTAVDDLSYSSFAGYLTVKATNYALQVRDSTGAVTVAQYGAPLGALGLGDSAIIVLASGFLTPANNSNGPAFGLYVALPSGGALIPLPAQTPRLANPNSEFQSKIITGLFPNPAKDAAFVGLDLQEGEKVIVNLISIDGKSAYSVEETALFSGEQLMQIPLTGLQKGLYILNVSTPTQSENIKLNVIE